MKNAEVMSADAL
ncbi:hypothetical protein CP8484711_0652A, partial [Chlamydia psittaci 84-8471/1]